jgi:leader peptidase (prepilin peptidase)/N-methyltransferase
LIRISFNLAEVEVFLACSALAIGAVIGSFLNVVIHRYPRGESVVFPSSRCPHCGHLIAWYDNVPILSFLVLGARCRSCKAPIAPRYLLVELANGLFYAAIILRTGVRIDFVLIAALVSMTIVLMYIDAEIQILPDVIDLPGIGIGVALATFGTAALGSDLVLALDWKDSVIGAAAGAGIILALAGLYYAWRRVEGMGIGDSKMLAMIGATVGWRPLYAVLLIGCVTGAVFGIATAVATRRTDLRLALPFGVFLGAAFLVILFFGEQYVFAWIPALRLGR